METTKKVWCVTNGITESVHLFENQNTAKKLFASLVRKLRQKGGRICGQSSIKSFNYFAIFVETRNNGFYWIKCQKITISQL